MKKSLGFAVLFLSLVLFSFKSFYTLDAVTTAIGSGNVDQLSPYLDYRVDISLPDKSDTYSKSQAEMVIRDFFSSHSVRHFQVKQKGENSNAVYCYGLLETNDGNYRTSLFLKQKAGREVLQEIRFQPVP